MDPESDESCVDDPRAKVFWTETFENHLYPNWIGGGNCITTSSPDGVACDYPRITTSFAYEGTHSLWSHYDSPEVQAGTFMDRYFPETQNMYTRFYFRTRNFVYPTDKVSKLLFNTSDMGNMDTIWLFMYGDNRLRAGINHPQAVTCPPDDRGGVTDVTCNYSPNLASVPLEDNK